MTMALYALIFAAIAGLIFVGGLYFILRVPEGQVRDFDPLD